MQKQALGALDLEFQLKLMDVVKQAQKAIDAETASLKFEGAALLATGNQANAVALANAPLEALGLTRARAAARSPIAMPRASSQRSRSRSTSNSASAAWQDSSTLCLSCNRSANTP
jgi:hypothetical protein